MRTGSNRSVCENDATATSGNIAPSNICCNPASLTGLDSLLAISGSSRSAKSVLAYLRIIARIERFFSEPEVEFMELRIEILIDANFPFDRFDQMITGRQCILRLFNGFKCTCSQQREDRRAATGRVLCRDQNWFVQNICIYTIKRLVALGNPTAVDHALNGHAK